MAFRLYSGAGSDGYAYGCPAAEEVDGAAPKRTDGHCERLDVVEAFSRKQELLQELVQTLRHIGDVERLISKVAVGRINPREMLQLKKALKNTLPIKELLAKSEVKPLEKLADQLNPCQFLLDKIEKELQDDVPISSNQGGMMRDGIDSALDELRKIAYQRKRLSACRFKSGKWNEPASAP